MLPVIKRNEQNWLPGLFNDFFSEGWPLLRATAVSEPAINVSENDKNYLVELAAPGRKKDDFQVHINDQNNLVVSMVQREENCDKKDGCKYIRKEFNYSRFEQTLLLPDDVDKDNISAKMEDGVLYVTLPKLDPEKIKQPTKVIAIQ